MPIAKPVNMHAVIAANLIRTNELMGLKVAQTVRYTLPLINKVR